MPNPFSEDEEAETTHWFHLPCAADKRPDKFALGLAAFTGELPDSDRLARIAQLGIDNPKLVRVLRAERSPSGRARCRQCRELIEKAELRVAIETEADAMSMSSAYFVHARCAPDYVGPAGLREKLERVSTKLEPAEMQELFGLLEGS